MRSAAQTIWMLRPHLPKESAIPKPQFTWPYFDGDQSEELSEAQKAWLVDYDKHLIPVEGGGYRLAIPFDQVGEHLMESE